MTLRRSIITAALAALVSLPGTALAQGSATSLQLGGGLGFEFGDLDGFGLRADAVLPLQRLDRQVSLGLVGTVGFTHFGEDEGNFEIDVNVLKFVPAIRFGFDLTSQFSLYGDAGLGVYFADISVDTDPFFGGDADDDEIGLMMRFAAGGLVAITPKLQIGAELGVNPYFGDLDDNTISLFGTLLYKL